MDLRVEFHPVSAADGADALPATLLAACAPVLAAAADNTPGPVLILAMDAGQARTLDQWLWQGDDFIAHCLADDPDQEVAQVVIAAPGQAAPARPCLVNLRAQAVDPAASPGCRQVIELIPADAAGRQAARQRWRAYQQYGLKPVMVER